MAKVGQLQFKITKGINQDADVQTAQANQAFRLFNIKSQSTDPSSIGDLTNEKGNTKISILDSNGEDFVISDTIVGLIQCTDSTAVIFTYSYNRKSRVKNNKIIKITYEGNGDQDAILRAKVLAEGNLNIGKKNEISGIFVYENSEIQKIYWVDGINELRYLNIANDNEVITDANKLSSKPNFNLGHKIIVERQTGGGSFSAGVVQYAFTYFNKYGAETNIVDITPLYYIGETNRGLAADEVTNCSFKVTVTNPDTSFEYLRVYSIQRTSINGTPVVSIVGDIKLNIDNTDNTDKSDQKKTKVNTYTPVNLIDLTKSSQTSATVKFTADNYYINENNEITTYNCAIIRIPYTIYLTPGYAGNLPTYTTTNNYIFSIQKSDPEEIAIGTNQVRQITGYYNFYIYGKNITKGSLKDSKVKVTVPNYDYDSQSSNTDEEYITPVEGTKDYTITIDKDLTDTDDSDNKSIYVSYQENNVYQNYQILGENDVYEAAISADEVNEVAISIITTNRIDNLSYNNAELDSVITVTSEEVSNGEGDTNYQMDYKITIDNSLTESTTKNNILKIHCYDSVYGDRDIVNLSITLLGDLEEDNSNITGTEYSIIDYNNNEPTDTTSLLFKTGQSNQYSTLTAKDNTLFLGNYTVQQNRLYNIFTTINNWYANNNYVTAYDTYSKISTSQNTSQVYNYIPDLTLNSQQKKIFKAGETYNLGVVFIFKNGYRSSVYPLPDLLREWKPALEPKLVYNSSTGEYYYKKPSRTIQLSSTAVGYLASQNIIGIVPVYAQNSFHNVLCQGFVSPTIKSNTRISKENIQAQYSWYYRSELSDVNTSSINDLVSEIQCLNNIGYLDTTSTNYKEIWTYNNSILTINTPEVEADESLQSYELQNCLIRSIKDYTDLAYLNSATLDISLKYTYSGTELSAPEIETDYINVENYVALSQITTRRVTKAPLWKGFLNQGWDTTETNFNAEHVNKLSNYKRFWVYPWQRNIIGAELEGSIINSKKMFSCTYASCIDILTKTQNIFKDSSTVLQASIYRDFDTTSLLKLNNAYYQGNTDYVLSLNGAFYMVTTIGGDYPTACSNTTYAGYNSSGQTYDPVSIKYKCAPHIVVQMSNNINTSSSSALRCAELYNTQTNNNNLTTQELSTRQWLPCGDIAVLKYTESDNEKTYKPVKIIYKEGDYFFGRFDSLRTYAYTNADPNSVIEIVSGMLCSRVNLDARTDRNRGINNPAVSITNFNLFNPVYNQLNNYFTYSYIDYKDLDYDRTYNSSIQWSLTKTNGNEIDNWCNIVDTNTLDLDGDKGALTSLQRLGNNIIALQETGIAQVQYNEKTQIATTQGVPIEIANSGKVDGKYYLYDNIGCQHAKTITKSASGLYFMDEINKAIYKLGANGQIEDLGITSGMHSWELKNVDDSWRAYYDSLNSEVLFTNNLESLVYNDAYSYFSCFLGYGGIEWNFKAKDHIVQICPVTYSQPIYRMPDSNFDGVENQQYNIEHGNPSVEFWLKNSTNSNEYFGNVVPIELTFICNPEVTVDKTFDILEYRADTFEQLSYLPEYTFNYIRAYNEYQDTGFVPLAYRDEDSSIHHSSNLKKKFHTWRIQIPRALKSDINWFTFDSDNPNSIDRFRYSIDNDATSPNYDITFKNIPKSRDRIRNHWCYLTLTMFPQPSDNPLNHVLHDMTVWYYKQ